MTDLELLEKLKNGDSSAMEVLFDRFGRLVYSKAFNLVRNRSDAEDITQNVFVRAFKYSQSFNGNSVKSWLAKITYNCSIDLLNKKKMSEHTVEVIKDNFRTGHPSQGKSQQLSFPELIAPLNPLEQEVLTLKYIFKFSYKEISETTGKAEGSLRNIVWGALKSLRQEHKNEL